MLGIIDARQPDRRRIRVETASTRGHADDSSKSRQAAQHLARGQHRDHASPSCEDPAEPIEPRNGGDVARFGAIDTASPVRRKHLSAR
jgi:hypothetical protein